MEEVNTMKSQFYRNINIILEDDILLEINKIYNMDCLEGMKIIPDSFIDLCITDPPY